MFIRSQDGKILLNVSQVGFFGIIKENQIRAFIPNRETGVFLGAYIDGKRTVEVLNQIEAYYDAYATRGDNSIDNRARAVYQMPAE